MSVFKSTLSLIVVAILSSTLLAQDPGGDPAGAMNIELNAGQLYRFNQGGQEWLHYQFDYDSAPNDLCSYQLRWRLLPAGNWITAESQIIEYPYPLSGTVDGQCPIGNPGAGTTVEVQARIHNLWTWQTVTSIGLVGPPQ